ncbi:hypothetical protein [Actinomadura sp. RB99]|uniref:hypothetical protein n=1 Tax=Actinomadura sp. RB99 TaxID=2691577 RepID=UPI0016872712|nr:hypothetical protein [Actinomadura sp. RB99]
MALYELISSQPSCKVSRREQAVGRVFLFSAQEPARAPTGPIHLDLLGDRPSFSYSNTPAAWTSAEAERLAVCARGCRWCLLLLSALLSLAGRLGSALQTSDVSLMLPRAASLGAVDEQDSWVGCSLVQLDFERVGVVLDETSQGRPILLDNAHHSIRVQCGRAV